MKNNGRFLFLLCVILAWGAAKASAGSVMSGAPPTDADVSAARVFDEPLVPTSAEPSPQENAALMTALTAYGQRTTADDCSSLADFASNFPQSRWTASLLLHLGVEYYNYGYFSKALDAWQRAWTLYQINDYPPAKAQADRALGELSRMYASIGRASQLSTLLDSTKDRDVGGPGAQLVHSSAEALWIMNNKPDYSFGCGPSALDRILLHFAPSKAGSPILLDCKSDTNGFSLNQVADISHKLGMNYQMAYREPGAPLIVPSVVHWKIDHYAALIEQRGDAILVQDYTFVASLWVSKKAVNEEASGYYLVPSGKLPAGWRAVSAAEGQTVRGRGQTNTRYPKANCRCYDTTCGGLSCTTCKCKAPRGGMTTYTFHALLTSLTLVDTPVSFDSPVGPQVAFTTSYNQTEADQPANFYYSNLGPLWDCSLLSYVEDNPTSPGADLSVYMDGGGELDFNNFNPTSQTYAPEAMTQALLVRLSTNSYELQYSDGSRREYARSDGATGSSRRIFLTQEIDPFGNIVQLNYDSQLRITNIVNAIGQAMTLGYTNAAYPFQITSVSDPFGRTAQLLYDTNGLLIQITDVLGLTSQYTYGANQFITALTTPYGTTTFTTGMTNGNNYLSATDPLGGTEAVEYSQSLSVPHALPASEVPHGLSTFNLFIDARDSFFWDKKAFAAGGWDWTKAHIYHWLHQSPSGNASARILESEKDPLESRIWYNYPGESTNDGAPYYLDAAYTGSSDEPTIIARVMDDGTTQLYSRGYNALGNVTNTTDPLGRNFSYTYASNNMDLVAARMTHNGKMELLMSATYNPQHLPLTLTDAAGQTTTNTYNPRGQILSTTDPLGETTTYAYDPNGFLLSITGPLQTPDDVVSFTYDAFNRVRTVTDTEGYTLTYAYDAADRPTQIIHPDGTSELFVYSNLDLAATADRLGRWTTNTYNASRQLVQVRDPLGRITSFDRCKCGELDGVTDPLGRTTSWDYDIQGRPIAKHYPDGSTVSYQYENTTSRLRLQLDELGQQTEYQYYPDGNLMRVGYPNAIIATPSVSYTYDPDYNRVLTRQDGMGTTTYTYNPIAPVPALGAGQLASEAGPFANGTVTYQYDALGRVVSQAINGVAVASHYDVLGRPSTFTNALGSFQCTFAGATWRPASLAFPNGQTDLLAYYNNLGDERLQQIKHLYPNASLLSACGYAYDAVGQITSWTNQWDTLPARVWLSSYDAADELTNVASFGGPTGATNYMYVYDLAANRTLAQSNAVSNPFQYNSLNQLIGAGSGATNGVTYEWDAAHRLTAINNGSQRSEFAYDGLDRRVRIVEKQDGLVVADNCFLWCNDELCEERDATGAVVVKRFFPQGESLVGSSGKTNLFYTRDHLGSIREAVDATGTLQARYDYDPYGQQSVLAQSLSPSFAYTGLYQHEPSGLYFALYRSLDPKLGRWLGRDQLGEAVGLNLYDYVDNDPILHSDPSGHVEPVTIYLTAAAVAGGAVAVYKFYLSTKAELALKERLDQLAKLHVEAERNGWCNSLKAIEDEQASVRETLFGKGLKEVGKAGSNLNQQAFEAIGCPLPDKVSVARDAVNNVNPNILKESPPEDK
jgi:RHS repeat-associated protein